MSIDIKEVRNETREGAGEARETVTNAATGAVVSMMDAATDPVGTARREVRRLARRGEPVNRRVAQRVERTTDEVIETADDVVSGNLAVRLALNGIRVVRNRSRRKDVIGDVLHGGLSLVNTVLDGTARELGKFQQATQPPSRSAERRPSPARRSPARRARRTPTRARRTS